MEVVECARHALSPNLAQTMVWAWAALDRSLSAHQTKGRASARDSLWQLRTYEVI